MVMLESHRESSNSDARVDTAQVSAGKTAQCAQRWDTKIDTMDVEDKILTMAILPRFRIPQLIQVRYDYG